MHQGAAPPGRGVVLPPLLEVAPSEIEQLIATRLLMREALSAVAGVDSDAGKSGTNLSTMSRASAAERTAQRLPWSVQETPLPLFTGRRRPPGRGVRRSAASEPLPACQSGSTGWPRPGGQTRRLGQRPDVSVF
eukprot:TRINITY_DN17744_c0_g1_i2.p1 TRINITY_DN17744_c0_g1~~TRINITY_DN17744_c0_g1_i2.p1  ORF type:complete len:134 (-),score=9.48 TRINITY_DN17744_c0_g1_i2:52-453(-)